MKQVSENVRSTDEHTSVYKDDGKQNLLELDKNKKRADSRLTEQPNKNANESQKIVTESIEELDSPFEAGSLL